MTKETIGMLIAIGGMGISAIGGIKSGNAAKRAGEANQAAAESSAELAEANAAIADLQADDALSRGTEEENRFRSMVRGAVGAQKAGFAGANIDVNVGSAVDVQADAAMLGELDALTIRTNAAREAWGYKVQSFDLHKRADIARKEGVYLAEAGRSQQTASRFQVAGSIVGGASSLMAAKYGFGGGR